MIDRANGRPPRSPGPIESWVFDLDNTLYPASCNLFAEIDRRMGEFISRHLGLDPAAARSVQKQYFHEYGTTLRGLMLRHGIDPETFLEYVHAIDMTPLAPDAELDGALRRLDGRKIIFTNGSVRHAENVIARLGIDHHIDEIFDIAAADYLPKPEPAAYAALVERHGLTAPRTALFEDLPRNLEPAAALGMTTVWVRAGDEGDHTIADYVDHVTDDLAAWLESVARDIAGRR